MKNPILPRFIAFWLTLALTAPSPAYALRPERAGSEEIASALGKRAARHQTDGGQAGAEELLNEWDRFSVAQGQQFKKFYGKLTRQLGGDILFTDAESVPDGYDFDLAFSTRFTSFRQVIVRQLRSSIRLQIKTGKLREAARLVAGNYLEVDVSLRSLYAYSTLFPSESEEGFLPEFPDEQEYFQTFLASLDLRQVEKNRGLRKGQGASYVQWVWRLAQDLLAWREKLFKRHNEQLKAPAEADVQRVIEALSSPSPELREQALSTIREEWRVDPATPHLSELLRALVAQMTFGGTNPDVQYVREAAYRAIYRTSEFLGFNSEPGQELALLLLISYLKVWDGDVSLGGLPSLFSLLRDEGFYPSQLFNLTRRARGLELGAPLEELNAPSSKTMFRPYWIPIPESPVRTVQLKMALASQSGGILPGTWKNVPARNLGDLLGYLEATSKLPNKELPKGGRALAKPGASLFLLESLKTGKLELWVAGAKQTDLAKIFPRNATVEFRPPAGGVEERYVLRFDRNTGRMLTVKENSPRWTPLFPAVPQRLISPNSPDWTISVEEPRLRGLAEYLFQKSKELHSRYALQTTDRNVVETIRAVYPVPGLEQYEGVLTQQNFGDLLSHVTDTLFIPAGSNIELISGGKWAFYETLEKPWKKIPILGGRSQVWFTQKKMVLDRGTAEKGYLGGWSSGNLATIDPESSRALAVTRYKDFLRLGKAMGIPPGAILRVQRVYEENSESFQALFGHEHNFREEVNHAGDFVWASYFFEEAMVAGAAKPYIVEAALRPDSFLDQAVWTPAKKSNQLYSVALDLMELSGQSQAVSDTLAALLEQKGQEWAEAFFWIYLFERLKEMRRPPGTSTIGHDQTVAGWVLDFLKREGFSDLHELEATLWKSPEKNEPPAAGSKALWLMRRFHDENFLTEKEKIALLEKWEQERPVALGLRQPPTAGAEEAWFTAAKTYVNDYKAWRNGFNAVALGPLPDTKLLEDALARSNPKDIRTQLGIFGAALNDWAQKLGADEAEGSLNPIFSQLRFLESSRVIALQIVDEYLAAADAKRAQAQARTSRRKFLKFIGTGGLLGSLAGVTTLLTTEDPKLDWTQDNPTTVPVQLRLVHGMSNGFPKLNSTELSGGLILTGEGTGRLGLNFHPASQVHHLGPDGIDAYIQELVRWGVALRLNISGSENVKSILIGGQRLRFSNGKSTEVLIPAKNWQQGHFGEVILPVQIELKDDWGPFRLVIEPSPKVVIPAAVAREISAQLAAKGIAGGVLFGGAVAALAYQFLKEKKPPAAGAEEKESVPDRLDLLGDVMLHLKHHIWWNAVVEGQTLDKVFHAMFEPDSFASAVDAHTTDNATPFWSRLDAAGITKQALQDYIWAGKPTTMLPNHLYYSSFFFEALREHYHPGKPINDDEVLSWISSEVDVAEDEEDEMTKTAVAHSKIWKKIPKAEKIALLKKAKTLARLPSFSPLDEMRMMVHQITEFDPISQPMGVIGWLEKNQGKNIQLREGTALNYDVTPYGKNLYIGMEPEVLDRNKAAVHFGKELLNLEEFEKALAQDHYRFMKKIKVGNSETYFKIELSSINDSVELEVFAQSPYGPSDYAEVLPLLLRFVETLLPDAAGAEEKTVEFSVPAATTAGEMQKYIRDSVKPFELPVSPIVMAFPLAEYVSNVVDHGKSSKTTLRIVWSEKEVRVTVQDNQPVEYSLAKEVESAPEPPEDPAKFMELAEQIELERIAQKKRPGGYGLLLLKQVMSQGLLKLGEHRYVAEQGNAQEFIFPVLAPAAGAEEKQVREGTITEISGIPSVKDLLRILDGEGVPAYFVEPGDFSFVFMLSIWDKLGRTRYIQRMLQADPLTPAEVADWHGKAEAAGRLVSLDPEIAGIVRHARQNGLVNTTQTATLEKLLASKQVVMINVLSLNPHKTLLEETIHVLEGNPMPHGSRSENASLEAVNDLIQILFFPSNALEGFRSNYTDWAVEEMGALQKRYVTNTGINPNKELRKVIELLARDIHRDQHIEVGGTSILVLDLLLRKWLSRATSSDLWFWKMQAETGLGKYLALLLKTERFSQYETLFPSMESLYTAGAEETALGREFDVYTHSSVASAALTIVPKTRPLRQVVGLPEDIELANAGLEDAARRAAQGRTVLVAIDAAYRDKLRLPPNVTVVILKPETMNQIDVRAVAAYLQQSRRLAGLLIDLSSGTIVFYELPTQGSRKTLEQAA